jgi:hypothetical protein
MRVDFLHRRVLSDVCAVKHDVSRILPDIMPAHYASQSANIGALVKRLNAVTVAHGIRNEVTVVERPENYVPGRLRFCGEWSPEELRPAHRRREDITIHWLVHPSTRRVTFTPLKWAYYIFMYWLYVMHELVHRHQNITRSTDASCRIYRPAAKESENRMLHDEQLYLGEYDEIEAHAHDIALELLALCPDLSFRDAMMKIRRSSHQSLTEQGMTTYPIYRQAFSGVRKHPVMPALHRKIKLWYRQLKQQRHAYDAMGLLCLSQQIIQNHDKV